MEGEHDVVMANQPLIAVADDDPVVLSFIQGVLGRDARYKVVFATTGPEAIDICRRMVPQALVLDAMMPGCDGFQVARTLRSDPATAAIKIIVLTALKERPDIAETFEAGADRYLAKPVTPKRLLTEIESVLQPASDYSTDTGGLRKGASVALKDGQRGTVLSKLPPGKWMGRGWGCLVRLDDGAIVAVEASEAKPA